MIMLKFVLIFIASFNLKMQQLFLDPVNRNTE